MPLDAPSTCDAMVVYGATGDLAAKMIFPALGTLARERLARDDPPAVPLLEKLADRMQYVAGDLADRATYDALGRALAGARHPLHYLAIPPELFGAVASSLARAGLAQGARIALEKPFGHDLASARALERTVEQAFPDASQVFYDKVGCSSRARACCARTSAARPSICISGSARVRSTSRSKRSAWCPAPPCNPRRSS